MKAQNKEVATEVAVREEAPPPALTDGWGAADDTKLTDLMVPKILLQQPLSQGVTSGVSRPGQFLDSIDGTVLADDKFPLRVIIFDSNRTLVTKINKKFSSVEPVTEENKDLEWEEKDAQDNEIKRTYFLNFFCLVVDAKDNLSFPYVWGCHGKAMNVAKRLLTAFARMKASGVPSAAHVYQVSSVQDKNDLGTFYVPSISKFRDSKPEEIATARKWYDDIRSSRVTVSVDNSDDAPAPDNYAEEF